MRSTQVGIGAIVTEFDKRSKLKGTLETELPTNPDVKKPTSEVAGDRTVFRTQSGNIKVQGKSV